MKLSEIEKMWENDSKIENIEIDSESIKTNQLHSKYWKILNEEKSKYIALNNKVNEIRRILWLHYNSYLDEKTMKENGLEEWNILLKSKDEYNTFIESDKLFEKYNTKLYLCEQKINFLESIIKAIMNRGFIIRNAVEFIKYTNGF